MALDPNIALQVQAPQIQNPLTTYAQVAGIQNAQQQNALTGLAIQQAQRQQAQTDAINDTLKAPGVINADGSINAGQALTGLAQAGAGAAIPGLAKQLTEAQTARLQQQKSALELGSQHASAIGQVLAGVNDQASYDRALQYGRDTYGNSVIASLPAQYDPTVVNQLRAQTQTLQQQLEQQNKQIDQQLAQAQSAETQRHNAATEAATIRGQDMTAETAARQQNLRALEYDPKTGTIINKATGQAIQAVGADGKPLASAVGNLTGEQSNAVAFGARALDAQNTLRGLEAVGTTNGGRFAATVGSIPVVGGMLSSAAQSTAGIPGPLGSFAQATIAPNNQQQSYEQAKRNFISAVLRKESGAAIADSEFANEDKKYFPQAGDSAATIEQKARARDLAVEALKAQAGPGAQLIPGLITAANQSYASQPRPGAQQPAQAAAPAAPAIAPDAALAALKSRAASNPALAARLKAMGY
ncbi:hypothetical protein [Burkholderia gladioli]|uniref:hypothetical protein n=1 Tax=Burkholderia gladioli TaxID=28095 RepID=UPI00163E5F9E|nr:hypothetical protein [Burkholderia gladioli]